MIPVLDITLIVASSINILIIAILIIKNKLNWALALSFLQAVVWAIRLMNLK